MKTIAIISQKGGSTKTTLAINLAGAAVAEGLQAVIIDLDPQASAKVWHKHRMKQRPDATMPVVITTTSYKFLEEPLATARDNGADVCIIDTAPHSSEAALEAAKIADIILVPCRPSYIDLRAVESTLNIIRLAGNPPAFFVLSGIRPGDRNLPDEAETWLKNPTDTNGRPIPAIPTSPVRMTLRSDCVHALTAGMTISEYAPGTPAALEVQQLFKFSFHLGEKVNSHQPNRERATA